MSNPVPKIRNISVIVLYKEKRIKYQIMMYEYFYMAVRLITLGQILKNAKAFNFCSVAGFL